MKKLVLLSFAALTSLYAAAQQRLVLVEEFTGENCGPCAYWNPKIEDFINQVGHDKVIMIKYQVPIPSAGDIYDQYKSDANSRMSYYSVNSAPNLRIDGTTPWASSSSPGFPGAGPMTAADLSAPAAIPSDFKMEVEGMYSEDNDSLIATVKVTALTDMTTADMKIRLAYVQTLDFTGQTPPGNNGEEVFEQVVRKMYPNSGGTLTGKTTWTANQTETYTIGGPIPAHLQSKDGGFWVAWLQDDADKSIKQSARSRGDAFPTVINNVTVSKNGFDVYPNPAVGEAKVRLNLNAANDIQIVVTDVLGKVVYNVPQQQLGKGVYEYAIPTSNYTNGFYNVSVTIGSETATKRLSVVK